MTLRGDFRQWRDPAIAAAVAIALYQAGMTLVFFLIPLFLVTIRKGVYAGGCASGLAVVGIGLSRFVMGWILFSAPVPAEVFLLDMLIPVGLIGGAVVVSVPVPNGWARYERILAGGVVASATVLPVMLYLAARPEFDEVLARQFQILYVGLAEGEVSSLVGLAKRVVYSGFGFGLFGVLAFDYLIAYRMAVRRTNRSRFAEKLDGFRVRDEFVWPLLMGWAAVLASLVGRVPDLVGYVGWNLALTSSSLFGFQGTAIVRHWLRQAITDPRQRTLVGAAVAAMAFVPGLNVVPLGGLPLLGLAELWISFRNEERRRKS